MGKATQGASVTIEELEVASRNLVAVPHIRIHEVTGSTNHITDTRLLDVLKWQSGDKKLNILKQTILDQMGLVYLLVDCDHGHTGKQWPCTS